MRPPNPAHLALFWGNRRSRVDAVARGQMVGPFLRTLGFVLMATALARPVSAADSPKSGNSYAVTAWSADAGLPAPLDTVFSLAQDRVGYLWLGTRSGLVRFDGSQFFPWGSRGEPALPGRSVRALASARDGSLWLTFADASGITRIRNDNTVVVYSEQDGLAEGNYSAVLEDRRGRRRRG